MVLPDEWGPLLMKTSVFNRWVEMALAVGAIVFVLLLAGVGSGALTSPAP